MSRKDREGWQDDATAADRSQWRSGGGGALGGVYHEGRGTELWVRDRGGVGFGEDRITEIPEPLRNLYGLLVVLSGPRCFDLHPITQRRVTIGRDQTDIDIRLEDLAVSHQHAVIIVDGNNEADGEFRIIDGDAKGLRSRTGTAVNGKYVSETVLKDRDRIQLGETHLLFVRLWPEIHSEGR